MAEEPSFQPEDQFLRRIPPWYFRPDGHISPAAFENDKGTNLMSVNWLKLSSVERTLDELPKTQNSNQWGVASITHKLCISLNQKPKYSPTRINQAHCDIIGKKNLKITRALRDGAICLQHPSDNTV